MPRRHALSAAALLASAAGLAAPAAGQTRDWIAAHGLWSNPANWAPAGVPGPGHLVRIGAVVGVHNTNVTLTSGVSVGALQISDGMQIINPQWPIAVAGNTLVTGWNFTPDGASAYSTLRIAASAQAVDFSTQTLQGTDGARIYSYGSDPIAVISGLVTLDETSEWMGNGVVYLTGTGPVALRNDGTIRAAWDDLTFNQVAGGATDLDGLLGNGRLYTFDSHALTFTAPALTDSFSGTIAIHASSSLTMNIAAGWTADSASELWSAGNNESFASLAGAPFTFAGTMTVQGSGAYHQLTIGAPVTFAPSASVTVRTGALLHTEAAATILGGQFTTETGARIFFAGPTTVRGGAFASGNGASGFVFAGPTEWDGAVTFAGHGIQFAPATVIGPTTITADIFEMDAMDAAWSVHDSLTVNAGAINPDGSGSFDATLLVGGSPAARLTLNLGDPAAFWTTTDQVTIEGDEAVYATRIAGSPVRFAGPVAATGGRSQIDANVVVAPGATLHAAQATTDLRFTRATRIDAGATVVGAGTIRNGDPGAMTLADGASVAAAKLINEGVLEIAGDQTGAAHVARFVGTPAATLRLDVGGPPSAAAHDRLTVASAADLGGSLEIRIAGEPPRLGDAYTLLTAPAGVSGVFAADPVTDAGDRAYEWQVLYTPTSVRLRLRDVRLDPCAIGDWNGDGVTDSADITAFLTAWLHSAAATDRAADLDADGATNSRDISAFLAAWLEAVTGPC